jgi:tetratricopeptide (TPR) repeat protein
MIAVAVPPSVFIKPLGPACKSNRPLQDHRRRTPNAVKTETRHALKQDKFAQAAKSSASWVTEHRPGVVRWVITIVVALAVVIGLAVFVTMRMSAADMALGAAMDVYNTPLAAAGAPAQKDVYTSAADRAKAAQAQFQAVADKYSMLKQGKMARYFVGLTDQELGQTSAAESALKSVAGSWDRDVANLAKIALAGLYQQNKRDSEAVALYNQIIAKPSTTVPAAVAQLDLADLYATEGKQDQARALWAKVQDADKEGAAGSIAAQKLQAKQ